MEAIEKYYSEDIESVESMSSPGMPAEMKGLQAVKGKNKWWLDNHDIQKAEVNGPYIGENQFALEYVMDVTPKGSGTPMHMNEMALYTVEGDKIVHEHFFYKTS